MRYTNTLALLLLSAVMLLSSAVPTKAHPHVYVDASLTFVVGEDGLSALRQNWFFDDIFSQAILADLGLDEAALGSPEGQAAIRTGAFAYLVNYQYFTFIENGGKRLPVAVSDFKASLREGRLVYDFTVPLSLSFDQLQNFRVAIFDKEYYSDILLVKESLAFEGVGAARIRHGVHSAKDQTYWQFVVPEAVHLTVADPAVPMPEASGIEVADDAPGPLVRFMNLVRNTQKQLTVKLNGFASDIKGDPFGPALWMFLGFSFLYGIVHAVGPGHGKTVVCSYFLSNPGSFFSGALMGNAITFVHMGSAAAAVGIAYALFSSGMGGFQAASRSLQPASYALLAIMGLYLAVKAISDLLKGGMLAGTSCPIDHDELAHSDNIKRVLMVSFVTGLVPCPGAAVILAFSIGLNILWAGMLAIVAMAIGMGLTTTLFAWAAVAARSATLTLSGANKKFFNWVYGGLSICGAVGIGVFGTVLFFSTI